MSESDIEHAFYVWAVEMASVWDARGDLDGYCYWWSWRIKERFDEEERVGYEAWKYAQMKEIEARRGQPTPRLPARQYKWKSPSKKRRKS